MTAALLPRLEPSSPADDEAFRLRCKAEFERRVRTEGSSAGPQPHSEYEGRLLDWIVEKLGVPRNTIEWSLNPGYEAHQWDGDVDPLAKMINAISEGRDCGVESATGCQKAQPVDEPVLTPTGWQSIGSLRLGDHVIGSNGLPTRVTGVFPQGRKEVFSLAFSDGSTTRACGAHLWSIQDKSAAHRGSGWRTVSTLDMARLLAAHPDASWRIPVPRPIEMRGSDLPLDPYLLGVLLGDGGLRSGYPTLSSTDAEIVNEVEESLPQDIGVVQRGLTCDYGITGGQRGGRENPLTATLRTLDLMGKRSENKHIPPEYLIAAQRDRLALLQGLMDTDGFCRPSGAMGFCSTSRDLANGVQDLVRSLGGTATLTTLPSWFGGKRCLDAHWVYIRLPDGINPFRLARKAARVVTGREPRRLLRSVVPDGEAECVCIRVAADDHLYVTRDYIVTHNTYTAACITYAFLAVYGDSRVIHVAPKEDQLLTQIWMEMGKLWPRFQAMFPEAEFLPASGKLRMKPARAEQEVWAAQAFVCGVGANEELAGRAKGFHAGHMLIISEETQSIDGAIMSSLSETRTDDHNLHLALGNPDHQRDELHQFCVLESTIAVRISADDHPNVVSGLRIVPGAIGRRRLAERKLKNQPPDSRRYLSQIRGVCPAQSSESLIQWAWCEASAKLHDSPNYRVGGAPWMGVDPANSDDGDPAAIAYGDGACCTHIDEKPCPDANKLGEDLLLVVQSDDHPIDQRHVGVDGVGVGAGTVNAMRKGGFRPRVISEAMKAVPGLDEDSLWSEVDVRDGEIKAAGPKVVEAEKFDNIRSQALWKLREDVRLLRVAIPYSKKLFEEMTAFTFATPGGKIEVCETKAVKKLIKRSPNQAMALACGNFVRRRAWVPRGEGKEPPPSRETDRNRDFGLERRLAEHAKRVRLEENRIKRMFRKRA